MSKNKSKKSNIGQIIYMAIMLVAGMVCGAIAGAFLARAEENGESFFVYVFVLLLAIYLAMFIQMVVHEAGHLVFGLLTGYHFSSFRIGSFMFIKENGKIRLRKFSLAGTGGQCLMVPPNLIDGKMPIVLYNLGGCLMNMLVSSLFAIVAYFSYENAFCYIFSVSMVVTGLAFAVSNGIPMQVGPVSNDGHNALSLGKNPVALKAFWLQLKINEQISKGKRLKEMPVEWFAVPAEKDMDNGLVATLAVFHANWLMDQCLLDEAREYIEELLQKKTGIIGLHRSLLISDRIYCELVVKDNVEEAVSLHNKEHEKFIKQMKNNPSIIRSEYAYAMIAEQDEEKAKKLLERFEKVAKTYPYPQEIEGERELIFASE